MDAMLIYNRTSLADPTVERIASVQWSRDGQQCVLYLDGTAQAYIDFASHTSFCRSDFPNYIQEQGDTWRKSTHAWDDATLQRFEATLYA